jgi:Spy/CpxP family protein refolding chaperone
MLIPRLYTNEQINKMRRDILVSQRKKEMKELHQFLEQRRGLVSKILNSNNVDEILALAKKIESIDLQTNNFKRYIYNL